MARTSTSLDFSLGLSCLCCFSFAVCDNFFLFKKVILPKYCDATIKILGLARFFLVTAPGSSNILAAIWSTSLPGIGYQSLANTPESECTYINVHLVMLPMVIMKITPRNICKSIAPVKCKKEQIFFATTLEHFRIEV